MGVIVEDQWQFITATYDGSEMTLFKDVTSVASIVKSGDIIAPSSVNVAIVNQPTGAGERPYHGYIDDIRIYDRALSNQEIQDIRDQSCSQYINLSSLSIREDTALRARQEISMSNLIVPSPYDHSLTSTQLSLSPEITLEIGAIMSLLISDACE